MGLSRILSWHNDPFVVLKGRTQKQARRRKYLARMVGMAGLLSLIWAPVSCADYWGDYWTYMNYLELALSYVKQVDTAVNTQLAQVQGYAYQVQNLRNAPAALTSGTIQPFQAAMNSYKQFQTDAQALQTSVTNTENMLTQRGAEAQTLASNPEQYWQMEATLAQQQGGNYQAALARDQATLQDLTNKATALQNAANNLPSGGEVEGLDKLNTSLTSLVEETMNLNRQMAQENTDQNAKASLDAANEQAIETANATLSQQLLTNSNNGLQAVNAALQSQPTGVYNLSNIERQAWKNASTTSTATAPVTP